MNFNTETSSINQKIKFDLFGDEHQIYIKREDLLHEFVSGNKFRKLKYNLLQANSENKSTILTFGGAFSNHIAATAFAANSLGFKSIGVIRGEELENQIDDNPTLSFAQKNNMNFLFVDRETYRNKSSEEFLQKLKDQFGDFYLVPEGGTNPLAIKGCQEILTKDDEFFDYICCAVGTAGTISGILNSSSDNQKVLGFPALKGDFFKQEIQQLTSKTNFEIISDYHFGGYAKVNSALIEFLNEFKSQTEVALDPVYTGKMCYGIQDLISKKYFKPNSKILIIHTGGLQGIQGMNSRLIKQKLPLINV